jgi:plasmid stabilization system protein ParE
MKIRFAPRAVEDLIEIASYLKARNPHAASRVRKSIDESLKYLAAFPRVGRAQTTEAFAS